MNTNFKRYHVHVTNGPTISVYPPGLEGRVGTIRVHGLDLSPGRVTDDGLEQALDDVANTLNEAEVGRLVVNDSQRTRLRDTVLGLAELIALRREASRGPTHPQTLTATMNDHPGRTRATPPAEPPTCVCEGTGRTPGAPLLICQGRAPLELATFLADHGHAAPLFTPRDQHIARVAIRVRHAMLQAGAPLEGLTCPFVPAPAPEATDDEATP